MSSYDYGKYFGVIPPLADALREGEERCWSDGAERDKPHHDYVLYLGCNVLRTVNLAETITAILNAMGVDFVALGGPATCCGIIHSRNGDEKISTRLTGQTFAKFDAYAPKAVLTYCPSCHEHMDAVLPEGKVALAAPYRHVTEFIADNMDRLKFVNRVERRVLLHVHHVGEQPRKDAAFIMRILDAIAGLEIIVMPADDVWGPHCGNANVAAIGEERYDELTEGLFAAAKAEGADTVVAGYHSCYRQLCEKEAVHGIEVVHFADLVAEALGLAPFSHGYKAMKIAGDAEGAFDKLAPAAVRRGVNMKRLEAATRVHFGKTRV